MFTDRASPGDRIRAAIPVLLVHGALALVLLNGLQSAPPPPADTPLTIVDLPLPERPREPEAPPPPPADGAAQPLRPADPRPEGASAPPALKAEPTPVVAPEPVVRPPILPPPTLPAAPLAGAGAAPSSGAAPVPGPGTGGGGIGTGTASGRGGSGAGGGGGGGAGSGMPVGRMTPPRRIAGDLGIEDMPEGLRETGFRGEVGVLYRVEVDGRVSDCDVVQSSGSRALDATTCRLIRQRFRFRPARDARGTAFWSRIEEFHAFESDVPPPLERPRPRRGW